jgi:uncharacterized Rossmann fold enzyme
MSNKLRIENKFDFKVELGKVTPKVAEGAKIYVFGAGANWEYICKQYKYLVDINIDDYIDGFIDNDTKKHGSIFHGKHVYALSNIDTANAVILISIISPSANKEILLQLLNFGIYDFNSVFTMGWNFYILMRYEYERLLQFKDKYKNKRCFIVGNGPSLKANDLDKLKGEITFATNKIYMMFDKTEWRPSYYVCEEDEMFRQIQNEISMHVKCPAFYFCDAILNLDDFNLTDFYFFYLDPRCSWKPNRKPSFSEEPFIIQWGASITYSCLQLAAYMGFTEIILLGMDNTFKRGVKLNGEIIYGDNTQSHFDKDYVATDIYSSQIDVVNSAYETAREYCKQHGIKIRNATRGGALDVFERINFDNLFYDN